MIARLFVQLVLASTLFQFFPADVGELERRAASDAPERRTFDVLSSGRTLSRLPASADRALSPTKIVTASMGVVTSAESAIVMDRRSREVLYEKNIQVPRAIGSITKLMTAYVFLQGRPDVNAPATITAADVRLGAALHVSVGETVTVKNLLEASLVGSDNTATMAIARLSGLSLGDFVARMNEEAAFMGMQETTFADPTGLSSDNVSVVTDLARMFDVVLENETIRDITQRSSVTMTGSSGRTYTIESTDELLTSFVNQAPYKIVGGKTGFLPEAGYTLGSIFSREGEGDVIVVVLGSESKEGRFQDVKSLAVWAYQTFTWSSL
ncbi:D-alanyl-D-alanine carboxypeptidase [Candidatus Uhrbacteria bacterium]|nr:D-alanyl-D-alanine carboxypeptidase [Candidatus Uhrbacteria bacterium]